MLEEYSFPTVEALLWAPFYPKAPKIAPELPVSEHLNDVTKKGLAYSAVARRMVGNKLKTASVASQTGEDDAEAIPN
jgi:hypothetical protein